jgi:hypothetical protein
MLKNIASFLFLVLFVNTVNASTIDLYLNEVYKEISSDRCTFKITSGNRTPEHNKKVGAFSIINNIQNTYTCGH